MMICILSIEQSIDQLIDTYIKYRYIFIYKYT